jgi:hypothetical protein
VTRLDDPALVAHEYADEARRAPIAMSPFVANLPAEVDEPLVVRRANSIFVADNAE